MWIRGKHKLNLVNANELWIEDNMIYGNYSSIGGNTYPLGKYETLDRTIEVLDDIMFHIKNYRYNEGDSDVVYEMPQE